MRLRLLACLLLGSVAARAQDRFEIQVYDSEVAEPGHFGLELHTNYVVTGHGADAPELATQHVLHTTLEPHLGVFGWGELGAYLQGALRPEGTFDFAGVKLRFKARWPERHAGFGFALNTEVSRVPASYEANVWGSELRPIVDWRGGPLYLSLNPILSTPLQGVDKLKPSFEPATKLALFATDALAFGVETYSASGSHAIYAAGDYTSAWFDVNVGVGRGLGSADGWVAKVILGVHPPGTPPSHAPVGEDR